MRQLEGRIVVVTGGSAGVGRATVRAFALEGANVAILARGDEGLTAAAEDVRAEGRRALALRVDVAEPAEIEEAADRVERELGPIDIWVNNAMTSVFAPLHEIEAAEYRRVTEVTYLGTVYGTMAALRRMRPRDAGVIVLVGSALAYRGIPLQSAYCGAKHAIQGMVDSLRSELIHECSRVKVTTVHLPALNTPQFDWVKTRLPNRAQPVPPIYQPELAALAVIHAALHPSRKEWWLGGSTTATILADRLASPLLDRYLGRTGYAAQQTEEPDHPERPFNLWTPVRGDHGARGRFNELAKGRSLQWWAVSHRRDLILCGTALVLTTAAALRAWRA
jgi:NAD(P)-dependent dehydrogenase (short-subunit alcohol dehydrogenase family)